MAFFQMKKYLASGQSCKVEIIAYKGEVRGGEYGDKYEYDISVDGKPFIWQATKVAHNHIQELGDEFMIRNDQGYFKYCPVGSVEVQRQNTTMNEPNDYKSDVNRGASLNLAAQFELFKLLGGKLNLKEWFIVIAKNGESLAPAQRLYVDKKLDINSKEDPSMPF